MGRKDRTNKDKPVHANQVTFKFGPYVITTGEHKTRTRVRLEHSDGFYIDVIPTHDGRGLEVISSGDMTYEPIRILTKSSNTIEIRTGHVTDNEVWERAKSVFEVWKAYEYSPMRKHEKRNT